jgi:hypothetical protein
MRRCLRALAGVWLACQLVALASPLTLVSDRFGIDQASCCPGIGPGQICPMHHHAAADRSTCKMESACAHHDAGLLTILATGIMPPPSLALTPVSDTGSSSAAAPSPRARAAVPNLPPPRA